MPYPDIGDIATNVRFMPIGARLAGTPNSVRAVDVMALGAGAFGLKVALCPVRTSKSWAWAALTTVAAPDGTLAANAFEIGDPALNTPRPSVVTLYINWTAGGGTTLTLTPYTSPTLDTTLSNWYRPTILDTTSGVSVASPHSIQLTAGRRTVLLRINDPYLIVAAAQDAGSGVLAIQALAGDI